MSSRENCKKRSRSNRSADRIDPHKSIAPLGATDAFRNKFAAIQQLHSRTGCASGTVCSPVWKAFLLKLSISPEHSLQKVCGNCCTCFEPAQRASIRGARRSQLRNQPIFGYGNFSSTAALVKSVGQIETIADLPAFLEASMHGWQRNFAVSHGKLSRAVNRASCALAHFSVDRDFFFEI